MHEDIAIPNITIKTEREYPDWVDMDNIVVDKEQLSSIIYEWRDYVLEYSFEHNVNPAMVYAIIYAESMGNPTAKSTVGAMGLMQLMPATADYVGVRDYYDPKQNIMGGCKYIEELYDYVGYDEIDMLHAWNAGLSLYEQDIVPYETKNFISKVLYAKRLIEEEML